MNIIPADDQHGVFAINVFTVPPENQQALIDCIRGDAHGAGIPGLLSRYLLHSKDGTQVIHYMHWSSEDAFKQATATNLAIEQTRQRVHQLGARPNLYEIVSVS